MFSVELLEPNAYNPNEMTAEQFAELAEEVRHLGPISKPIIARRVGNRFVTADRDHSWRAACKVGLT